MSVCVCVERPASPGCAGVGTHRTFCIVSGRCGHPNLSLLSPRRDRIAPRTERRVCCVRSDVGIGIGFTDHATAAHEPGARCHHGDAIRASAITRRQTKVTSHDRDSRTDSHCGCAVGVGAQCCSAVGRRRVRLRAARERQRVCGVDTPRKLERGNSRASLAPQPLPYRRPSHKLATEHRLRVPVSAPQSPRPHSCTPTPLTSACSPIASFAPART